MAKPPASYGSSLKLKEPEPPQPVVREPTPEAQQEYQPLARRRPMEAKADPTMIYLHPEGKKALRLYAVEENIKVHDILIEAVEEWARARGLDRHPFRVPSERPRRQR